MVTTLDQLAWFVRGTLGLAAGSAGYALAQLAPLPRPRLGPRGLARDRLLTTAGGAALEPVLRWLAALCAQARAGRADASHAALERLIVRAGTPWGLCADELLALCGGSAAAVTCATLSAGLAAPAVLLAGAAAFGVPLLRLHEHARLRAREIARRLPTAIDLMALCMGAGLDFVAALRLVTDELAVADDSLCAELQRVRQELALGRTRSQALREFAQRVPAVAVREFAHAVIQAEHKGSPLSEVLQVQAQRLRLRRSVAAEEAAARAAVLLALPLLLLVSALVLVMFGPFIVGGVGL